MARFAAAAHAAYAADPGPGGVEKIRALLEPVLRDRAVVARYLGPDNDETRTPIYTDREFGFVVLAHVYKGVANAPPHDHGPTWAIYGQATGVTEMTEWKLEKAPTDDEPGLASPVRTYNMDPGMAVAYQKGQLHSPRRAGDTRLIRIEGSDLMKVKRKAFKPA
ncbi:MAG: hypothetical protein FJX53_11135 [Alphaproteobacteria bacterium]|nr:hypothetical protein [Alphaproteobacteria bacterium]